MSNADLIEALHGLPEPMPYSFKREALRRLYDLDTDLGRIFDVLHMQHDKYQLALRLPCPACGAPGRGSESLGPPPIERSEL